MGKKQKCVALKYTSVLPAPIITAKGQGAVAEKLMCIARENGINVVNNPEVLDSLFFLDIGSLIPEELFQIVADILAFVYTMRSKNDE